MNKKYVDVEEMNEIAMEEKVGIEKNITEQALDSRKRKIKREYDNKSKLDKIKIGF